MSNRKKVWREAERGAWVRGKKEWRKKMEGHEWKKREEEGKAGGNGMPPPFKFLQGLHLHNYKITLLSHLSPKESVAVYVPQSHLKSMTILCDKSGSIPKMGCCDFSCKGAWQLNLLCLKVLIRNEPITQYFLCMPNRYESWLNWSDLHCVFAKLLMCKDVLIQTYHLIKKTNGRILLKVQHLFMINLYFSRLI